MISRPSNTIGHIAVKTAAGTVYRPLVYAEIEFNGKSRVFQFLVDSGADFSLLNRNCATEMGMDFNDGPVKRVSGVGQRSVKVVEKHVKLSIPAFNSSFDTKIFGSNDLNMVHNLLGRDNFFDQYLVGFDQRARKVLLNDRR